MARPKKKRTYVRKSEKLAWLQNTYDKLKSDFETFVSKTNVQTAEYQDFVVKKNREINAMKEQVSIANAATDRAVNDLALIKESILQHQRTLELVTQTAHNNAQMGRDLISSLVAKDVVKSNNVVGMTDGAKAVNVDGYGRHVG